jgi:hypothetical protein
MKLAVLLLGAAAFAAAEPNFGGNWMLNGSKSEYGKFPKPEVMMRTVQHQGSSLSMSTYQKGTQGEVTTDLQYTTDGKPVKNGENEGSARWDGETLVIESGREMQGAKLTQREIWSLSPDGKTLTISTHIKLPNGEYDVKQVFEKAPSSAGKARANF